MNHFFMRLLLELINSRFLAFISMHLLWSQLITIYQLLKVVPVQACPNLYAANPDNCMQGRVLTG